MEKLDLILGGAGIILLIVLSPLILLFICGIMFLWALIWALVSWPAKIVFDIIIAFILLLGLHLVFGTPVHLQTAAGLGLLLFGYFRLVAPFKSSTTNINIPDKKKEKK